MSAEAAKERLVWLVAQQRYSEGSLAQAEALLDALLAHGDDLNLARGGEQVGVQAFVDGTWYTIPGGNPDDDSPKRPVWVFPVSQEQSA